jgi:cytoskeletal protein CcmA (bactofilin family)/rare lipoprotein A (peptidoglycan hydrolase)
MIPRSGLGNALESALNAHLDRLRSVARPIIGILWGLTTPALPALSKTPGEVHCYHLACHRVLTIAETKSLVGRSRILVASFYDDAHVDPSRVGELTSSGEKFDPDDSSRVGSSIYPDGTELLLWNPINGRAAHVRVNDFAPFRDNRTLDVTKGVAKQLDITRQSRNALVVTVVAPPTQGEPRYRSFRTHSETKSYVGIYDEEASAVLAKKLIAENRELVPPRDTIRTANHLVGTLFDMTPRASLKSLPPIETAVVVTPPLTDAKDVQPTLVVAFDPSPYGPAPEARTEGLKFGNDAALCFIIVSMGIILLQRLRLQAPKELARTPPHEAVSAVEHPAWLSIIGPELQIVGCLITSHDVNIEGSINGDCVCRNLIIGPTGKLTGDVVAEEVLVDGSIKGRLLAKKVGLANRAVVIGDVSYCDLSVQRDATLEATVSRISQDAWSTTRERNQTGRRPGSGPLPTLGAERATCDERARGDEVSM